jgi:dTDP-4-amino-4,6-dideoxygalactose transaminase
MFVNSVVLKRTFELHKEEYEEAALRALNSGWYILGKEMEEFEAQLASWAGVKHCVALNSGTDALILAVRALGIGPGDEVIVPANAYIASVIGITENGATPVFVDADEHMEIDADQIEEKITDRTKAILPVHLYGQCSRMDRIVEIANRHGLKMIEDCAQCLGSQYNGQLAGTFGDIGCLSFYPTKPLGAFGDAGAILTNDDENAERVRLLRNYGSKVKYHNEIKGVNSRMDEVQAALLKVSLKYLNEGNEERRRQAKRYREGIRNDRVRIPLEYEGVYHVYHLFPVLVENRDDFQKFLKDSGVGTQVHYPIPPYVAECYSEWGYKWEDFQNAAYFARHEVSLPIYCGLPDEEIQYVIDVINRY